MVRRTNQRDLNAHARAKQALQLKKLGFTLDNIKERCGYADRSGAYYAIQRALKQDTVDDVKELRALESARMDDLLRTFMPKALMGDKGSAWLVLRISEQRCKLLGLDINPKIDQSAPQIIVQEVPAGYFGPGV